jgi:flagellar assembly protein FliH
MTTNGQHAMGDIDEKFFFDTHVFHDEPPEDENAPPPPPTFSEAELAAAKKEAFKEGHAQATQEQKDSQNQAIANSMALFTKDIQTLFAAEDARSTLYEQEAVHLTLRIFETIFPTYRERIGFDELRTVITDTIEKQRSNKSIKIYVAPDLTDGIEAHIKTITTPYPQMVCTVASDEKLTGNACRFTWNDGGAFFDPSTLAQEVLNSLKQTLADDGFTGHDEDRNNLEDAPSEPSDDSAQNQQDHKEGEQPADPNGDLTEKPDE